MKRYHRASGFREDGAVSSLCSPTRAINLRVASWTIRDEAVTCPKCKARMAAAGSVKP
jgi:hypothetical protein